MLVRYLTATLLLCAPSAIAAQDAPILIRGANLFDGARSLGVRDVLISNGRIERLGTRLSAPSSATIVDGTGKTLLPGFIDAHTHTFADVLPQALAFGVTTQLEMFTDIGLAAGLRADQRAGKANARSDIFSAGTLVTSPKGHGTQFGMIIPTISSPDSAQSFVDARLAEGSDFIKIVYDDGSAYALRRATIDKPTLSAVIGATHKRGKLAVVHIGSARGARDAIESGADGLVHIHADPDSLPGFAALVKRRGAFVIPTLTVTMSVTGTSASTGLVSDPRVDSLLNLNDLTQLKQTFPTRPNSRVRYAFAEAAVKELHAAGVPILAGSDTPNPGTTHGASIHTELELLVKAGLTPAEALASATGVPARAFKLDDRGRIAAGRRADMLLIEGDPTVDITATRRIAGIWKAGVRFDRGAYAQRASATRASGGAAPPGSESGEISSFDDGTTSAKFGVGWDVSTDQMAGGKSVAEITVVDGGAAGSAKALRINGTIDATVAYAWAGAVFMPGAVQMQPANLSAKKEIVFWAKGDGQPYRVMLFAQSRGMMPLSVNFQSTAEWKEHVFPLASFRTDGKDLLMLLIVGGPGAGKFDLLVDEVRIR